MVDFSPSPEQPSSEKEKDDPEQKNQNVDQEDDSILDPRDHQKKQEKIKEGDPEEMELTNGSDKIENNLERLGDNLQEETRNFLEQKKEDQEPDSNVSDLTE